VAEFLKLAIDDGSQLALDGLNYFNGRGM